jgi:TRAP-type C4-dicarboxylate transport system permease small subunit
MGALLEKLAVWWAILGGVVLLAIVLVTATNVGAFGLDKIARLFGATVSGLPGYEDFVRLAISGAALMLFPYCQLKRGHVAVDLFVNMTPRPVRLGLLETRADGALSRVLGWPEWPFYLPGIASLVLWAAITAHQVVAGQPDG